VLASQGRSFPVQIEYLPKTVNFEHEPVWEVAARECERIAAQTGGDFLVFMPGAYEISRTVQAVQGARGLRGFVVFPLHGELPPDAQDRAVARYDARKIIVSTNVAETSLTIDGVTAVIDSGLARMARYDPNRGINTLLIEKISRRERRPARRPGGPHGAGRLRAALDGARARAASGAGTAGGEAARSLRGGADAQGERHRRRRRFPWLEKPDPKALERAEALLADLGL
jgi:ATP-dependent helicase HrpB